MATELQVFKPQTIRAKNIQTILEILRSQNDLTIHDIVEKCHLSKTAVKKILDKMTEANLVKTIGKAAPSRAGGKPPEIYLLNNAFAYAISCSIVETDIFVELCDLKMDLICRESYSNGRKIMSYQEILENTASLIRKVLEEHPLSGAKLAGIAFSVPGIINYQDGIIVNPLHAPSWGTHLPFVSDMQKLLHLDCQFYIDNSSRFSTYNLHSTDDDRMTTNTVVIHYYSQFVGGSVLRGNHLVHGRYGLSGEFGHLMTDYTSSEICSCGKKGCFESAVRHQNIIRRAENAIHEYPDSVLFGQPLTFEALSNAADSGDTFACNQMDYLVDQFARLFDILQLTLDPTEFYLYCINAGAKMNYFHEHLQEALNRDSLSKNTVPLYFSVSKNEAHNQLFDHSSTLKGGIRFCFDQYFSTEKYM